MSAARVSLNARIVAKIRSLLARRDGDAVDDEPDALAYAQAEAVQLPMSPTEPRREPARRAAAARSSMAPPSMLTSPSMPPTDPRSSGSSDT